MAFKKTSHSSVSIETPEALYRDLRNRKIEGLLSHQGDILKKYYDKAVDKSDVALQLSTGSGKTLVGLLIGEWRRRKFKEKVVYLCPTIQLAKQVYEQANHKYGIKVNVFTGKQSNYSSSDKAEYRNAETIAVTTYSGLFNSNSFFDESSIIILDDAHAAENYIAKYWSLLIEREQHQLVFDGLVSILNPILSVSDSTRLKSDSSDSQWTQKIATPDLYDLEADLISFLDEHLNNSDSDKNLKYPWLILQGHLKACHIYVSSKTILIRPVIPPTKYHQPFSNAKQRLYMSATLGEGGELERITGVEEIFRLPVPEGWDKQGIGRRLFFFPERSLDQKDSLSVTMKMIQAVPRSLVLTRDNKAAKEFENIVVQNKDYKIFNSRKIEQSKQEFISTDKAVAIVANRYDGIDLLGDECRLLIVQDLQKTTNLQEKFLVTRLAAGVLLKDRTITRIVQAVGRCTRSATDYAAVVILGDNLYNILLDPEPRKFLHPELQAEIEFGNEQSKDCQESEFLDNLRIFLEHGEDWNQADEDILYKRDSLQQDKLPAMDKLRQAVAHEVSYQYAIWNNCFEKAVDECESVLSYLNSDDVRGYRAFWNYLAGSAAWMGAKNGINSMESTARKYFKRAAFIAPEVDWLSKLARLTLEKNVNNTVDSRLNQIIEDLANQLSKLGLANNTKFEREVKFISENIKKNGNNEEDSRKFEEAHERLGKLLGYQTDRSKADAAPDTWWIAGDDLCIVFEDHSSAKEESELGAHKVRQVASHPNWIKMNLAHQLSKQSKIIPVLITPCKKINDGAIPHAQDVCYWHLDEFRQWVVQAITIVRELKTSFSGEADLEWRKRAIQAYKDAKIDPDAFIQTLKQKPLKELKKAN